jgi:hypothetical protein
MGSKYLNERNLKSRQFAMHEDSSEIKLDLEANIDISSIDSRWPPESEPSIRYLVKTWPLSMSQLLILHAFFKATGLLPKETFPSGEVSAFE